ncbi:PorV/PorQ family protein [candidate division KSB1 bacterium]|nr:PorV/PorQ family protein [candidate division KSB1 bacterium]
MKRLFFCLASVGLWLVVISSVSMSGDLTVAKYAGEFISTGVGARGLGMGGAYVAICTDVTAGYWNPAGLIGLKYPQVMLMHASRFSGIVKYDYAAFALPAGRFSSLGISMIRLGVDDIPITALANADLPLSETNRPYIEKMVSDAEYAFYLSYAKAVVGRFSYGANIKLIRKSVGENSAWGIGFDFGVLLNPIANLRFGANLQDGTTTLLAWDTNRKELISPTLKIGFAYPFALNILSSKITPALDFDTRFENRRSAAQTNLGPISLDFHLGLEYRVFNAVALRIGSDVGRFSAGTGLYLPQLLIDYAFMSHDELGDTHRVSLKVSIEKSKFKRSYR